VDSGQVTGIIISVVAIGGFAAIVLTWIHKRSELKKLQLDTAASIANDDRLRELTEAAHATQRVTANELTNLRQQYVEIETRLATIERLLRDVDS
jgi:hypothetical protein